MDNLLAPACILLALTNLSFALLALSWKKQARKSEAAAMGMALGTAHTARDNFDAGFQAALRQATGGMYLAATRAGADEPTLEALRAAGRKLLGAPLEESIVQVPETV